MSSEVATQEADQDQLSLISGKIPAPKYRKVSVDDLPENDDLISPEPTADMVRSIGLIGVLQPIVIEEDGDGYRVESGRRRIKASRANGLKVIPAMVYPQDSGLRNLATISENEIRSANDVTSFLAVEALMEQHGVEHPEDIGKALGVNQKRVKKMMRLRNLSPSLLDAFKEGRVSPSAAYVAVKLPKSVQGGLAQKMKAGDGRLTIEMVTEARQKHVAKELAALGDDAFGTPSAAEAGSAPAFPVTYPLDDDDGEQVEVTDREEVQRLIDSAIGSVPVANREVVDQYGARWMIRVTASVSYDLIKSDGASDDASDEEE